MKEIRLQKYISDCGVMSRRSAEKAIVDGRILVNGSTAQLGQKIVPGTDKVELDSEPVIMPEARDHTYLMIYKPSGYVTTAHDERGRRCVTDLVRGTGTRLYPVGRLDMLSEGLLLLTDDGDFTYRMTHPKHHVPKVYHVCTYGNPDAGQMKILNSRMLIDGYRIEPVTSRIIDSDENSSLIEMTLHEGRNRQIRKMCQTAGIKIRSLKRVSFGSLELGDMKPGEIRHVSPEDIESLIKSAENGGLK